MDPLVHRDAGLEFLKKLDAILTEQGQLCGDKPSLADYAIFPFVRQFANTDRGWFDAQPSPALQAWLDGQLQSDIFANAMPKFPQWKSGDVEPVFGA
ncbi:MAG: glutathione S-transferase C-terminal domain-containing protein [Candidatus Phaeomarinobacter sp.]